MKQIITNLAAHPRTLPVVVTITAKGRVNKSTATLTFV